VKTSTAARIAWSTAALTLMLSLSGPALGLAHHPEAPLYDFWFEGLVGPPVFVIVGALIVSRRSDNLIGWLFFSGVYGGLQTVEEFSGRLRRETDLDALSADLIGVVRETVKPTHASLWLRAERES
jgi:hypothetical protein